MNEKINDGGPAFPNVTDSSGMSLRDYFAAKFMQEILSMSSFKDHRPDEKAIAAYMYADAMLEARQK